MQQAVLQEHPNHVIHLGDHIGDAEELSRLFPMLPVLMVRGNCDFANVGREEVLTEFGKFRFLVCHGHQYGVKSGLLRYGLAAREKLADVALFGHTHQAFCDCSNGIWFVNPGSCGGIRPSYAVIEISGDSVSCTLKNFDH